MVTVLIYNILRVWKVFDLELPEILIKKNLQYTKIDIAHIR